MPLQLAMLLFRETPTLAEVQLQAALSSGWPELPAPTDFSLKDNILSFQIGESAVFIGIMPAPIPWDDLEGPCSRSYIWPDAVTEVKQHTIHAIVSVIGELSPVQLSTLLTQICTAVMTALPQSIGIFWTNAAMVVPKGLFCDFATSSLPTAQPIRLWVDFRVGWVKNGKTSAGYTTGLAALGFMELETQEATEPPSELLQRFEAIAQYLLDQGPIIEHGNTVGRSATEHIRVTYSPSLFGAQGQVMRLTYEGTQQKKTWWRQ